MENFWIQELACVSLEASSLVAVRFILLLLFLVLGSPRDQTQGQVHAG